MEKIEALILITKINERVVDSSTIIDDKTKEVFKNFSKYYRDFLEQGLKLNSYELNSLKNGLLYYWNESINPDTEKFWLELKNNGIDYERKEPLRFALDKNRFRNVDHGIEARKHWTKLKKLKEVKQRFTTTEIEQLNNIIAEDEKLKLEILKKCLRKKQIAQTQYLKFGESMAYMINCGLWDKYFNKEEVEELFDLEKNFNANYQRTRKND